MGLYRHALELFALIGLNEVCEIFPSNHAKTFLEENFITAIIRVQGDSHFKSDCHLRKQRC
jgi:hypothetical protein